MDIEPNWFIQIVIGVTLGLLAPSIGRVAFWPFRYLKKHVLKWKRCEYHYSVKDGVNQIFKSDLLIKRDLKVTLCGK